MSKEHCTGCKNHCSLSAPKCVVGVAMAKRGSASEWVCKMCPKRCPLDALECSLGQTIYEIKREKESDNSL